MSDLPCTTTLCGIYLIQNTINKKFYIGQTIQSFEDRWNQHQKDLNADKHANPHLQNAWKKYGETAFEFHPLWKLPPDPELLNKYEKIMIGDFYNDRSRCYNLREGGGNGRLSETTKQRMSEARRGEKNPMWRKTGEDHPSWGKKHTEETRQKISEALTGRTLSDEHRRKLSEAHTGKTLSEETKQKMSETRTGKKRAEETKKKMSIAAKNRPKKPCQFCDRLISVSNHERHEKSCKHRPQSSPDAL